VAAGTPDHVLRLRDLGSGEEAAEPLQHPDAVSGCAFSADGQFLASMTGQVDGQCSLFIWDLRSRTVHLVASQIQMQQPAFAPRGNVLAYAPRGNTIAVFDAESRTPDQVHRDPARMINTLAISPDGQHAAAGCADGRVYLWETQAEGSIHTLGEHESRIRSLCFTADSKHIASFGSDYTLRFWPASGQERVPRTMIRDADSAIESVAFSPCGRFIASRGLPRARPRACPGPRCRHGSTRPGNERPP